MNQRIQELAEKCYEKHNLLGTFQFNKEKFAHLLIQECANVAADHEALDIYEEILEHFEVE